MSNYWRTKEGKQRERLYNNSVEELNTKLQELYAAAAKDIEAELVDVFLTILSSGEEVQINELYKYNRLYNLRLAINERLTELGKDILKELNPKMENIYKITSAQAFDSIGFLIADRVEAEYIAKSLWEANGKYWSRNIWCSDGLNAEGRIAKNMAKLQTTLEKGLTESIVGGRSKDKLVKTLIKRFDVSFNEADRLARTELNYIQNQSTLDSFKKAGVEKYIYTAFLDDRTSEICKETNNKVFDIVAAKVGENYPPLHANCRCTVLAVL